MERPSRLRSLLWHQGLRPCVLGCTWEGMHPEARHRLLNRGSYFRGRRSQSFGEIPYRGDERKDSPTTVYSDDWLAERSEFEPSRPFIWRTTMRRDGKRS